MKKRAACLICALTLLALCACAERPTEENARKRAEAYAQAVNFAYETPEEIYAFVTEDVKTRLSQPAFCAAFAKDRTYPYITPLYLFYPEVSMADDGLSATVVYQQAAEHYNTALCKPWAYLPGRLLGFRKAPTDIPIPPAA